MEAGSGRLHICVHACMLRVHAFLSCEYAMYAYDAFMHIFVCMCSICLHTDVCFSMSRACCYYAFMNSKIVLETPGTHLSTWLDQIQEKRLEQSNCSQSQRSAAAVPQLAQIMTTTTRHDQTKMGCANSPNFLMNAIANRVRQTVRVFSTLKIPN